MNLKSLLKILTVVCLSGGQMAGMTGVARSQPIREVRSPLAQSLTPQEPSDAEIDRFIKDITSGNSQVRSIAAEALKKLGYQP